MIKKGILGMVFMALLAVALELISAHPFTEKVFLKANLLILVCLMYNVFNKQLFAKFLKEHSSSKNL